MTDALVIAGLETLPVLLLALLLAASGRPAFRPAWLAVAVLLVAGHDLLLTRFLWQIPWTAAEGQWNWIGKLLALAGTLAVAALPAFGFRRSGLTLRHAPGSWPVWGLAGAFCLYALLRAVLGGDGKPADANSIAFMWSMPGPEEEIFYRGILLLAFNQAFRARRRILGADLGWGALLTSLLFGAAHSVSYSQGAVGLDLFAFANTFLLGLLWVWMRERTGSVAAPLVCHSVSDGFRTLF